MRNWKILRNRQKETEGEKRPRTMKDWIATACVTGALVVAAAAALVFIRNKDSLVLTDSLVVSMMGSKQEYHGRTQLVYDKDSGEVTLKNRDRSLLLLGVPVYQKASDEENGGITGAVLTRQMIYTNYNTKVIGRINHFGRISYENQIGAISTDGKRKRDVNGGYLFDGANLYLFLEPMKVTWGEETMELSPMSFIAVFNKQGFYYYDCQSDDAGYVSSGESVVRASDQQETYTLNMSNDIVDFQDGKSLLLPPNPESFRLFE